MLFVGFIFTLHVQNANRKQYSGSLQIIPNGKCFTFRLVQILGELSAWLANNGDFLQEDFSVDFIEVQVRERDAGLDV